MRPLRILTLGATALCIQWGTRRISVQSTRDGLEQTPNAVTGGFFQSNRRESCPPSLADTTEQPFLLQSEFRLPTAKAIGPGWNLTFKQYQKYPRKFRGLQTGKITTEQELLVVQMSRRPSC